MHHAGRIVSRSELVEHLYEQDFDRDSNTIEVFVGRLRKKLGVDIIQTVRGLGYVVAAPAKRMPPPARREADTDAAKSDPLDARRCQAANARSIASRLFLFGGVLESPHSARRRARPLGAQLANGRRRSFDEQLGVYLQGAGRRYRLAEEDAPHAPPAPATAVRTCRSPAGIGRSPGSTAIRRKSAPRARCSPRSLPRLEAAARREERGGMRSGYVDGPGDKLAAHDRARDRRGRGGPLPHPGRRQRRRRCRPRSRVSNSRSPPPSSLLAVGADRLDGAGDALRT